MGLLAMKEVSLGQWFLAREGSRRKLGLVHGVGGFSKVKERLDLEGVAMSFHLLWIKRVIVVMWEKATVKMARSQGFERFEAYLVSPPTPSLITSGLVFLLNLLVFLVLFLFSLIQFYIGVYEIFE